MSTGGGPLLGEGGFFGAGRGAYGGGGGGFRGFGPRGPFGPWAGCGCSSIIILLALILLACGGCLRMLEY